MSDPLGLTTPKPFVFDLKQVTDKIASYKAFMSTFNGKPGHNPHTFIAHNFKPLERRLNGYESFGVKIEPERTQSLFNAFLALDCITPPVVTPHNVGMKDDPQTAGRTYPTIKVGDVAQVV